MGNYVIEAGNYVIATPSELGNYLIADTLGPDRSGNVIADDLICHPRQDCSVPAGQGEPTPGVLNVRNRLAGATVAIEATIQL